MLLDILQSEKDEFVKSLPTAKDRLEASRELLPHAKYDFVVDGDVSLANVFELQRFFSLVGVIFRDLPHLAKNIWKSVNVTYRVHFYFPHRL